MCKDSKKIKKTFSIPDPNIQIDTLLKEQKKYELGKKGYSFYDIKHLKPIFAFDYLSLNGSDLCFDSKELCTKDFIGLLEGLKKISTVPYDELKRTRSYRFHSIDFDDERVSISRDDFRATISHKKELLKDEELPTLYQFDLQYVSEARACGFLYKGVFYIVWYDRKHFIYPNNN